MSKIILFFLLVFWLLSCDDETSTKAATSKYVTIGTFNIAWLGDNINDRIDREKEHYKAIAEIIKNSKMDVIGLQEIENHNAMRNILKYLPDYSYYLGKSGGKQNLAILFRKSISVKYIGEYMPLAVEEGKTRPGLVIECKYGNFDWKMMVVHFKSTSRYDNTKEKQELSRTLREQQAYVVRKWADSVSKKTKEKDIVIVGDFNDTPNRKKNNTLTSLFGDGKYIFLTANMKSCKYKAMYIIDHIVISKSAMKRYLKDSERVYNFFNTYSKEQAESISDHCPVSSVFDVSSQDND